MVFVFVVARVRSQLRVIGWSLEGLWGWFCGFAWCLFLPAWRAVSRSRSCGSCWLLSPRRVAWLRGALLAAAVPWWWV